MGARYGLNWEYIGEGDLMTDELGHKRHAVNLPCFLGGTLHSYRELGEDVRHCVLRLILVCVYCGREKSKPPRPVVVVTRRGTPAARSSWLRRLLRRLRSGWSALRRLSA